MFHSFILLQCITFRGDVNIRQEIFNKKAMNTRRQKFCFLYVFSLFFHFLALIKVCNENIQTGLEQNG